MNHKYKLTIAVVLISIGSMAQAPLGTPPPNVTSFQAQAAWYRGGNNGTLAPAGFNIFGFTNNSPIYTITNNVLREKLNGELTGAAQYLINGYTVTDGINTSGYLLLGPNTPTQPGGASPLLYQAKGAFSMLHLNGVQNSSGSGFTQEFGYRPWMKTGITFTANNDLMYMGVRALQPGQDQTEMTISWSDNSGSGNGPDDFAFRFMGIGSGKTVSTDLRSEDDLDGLHIARFAPTGEFGLGNTFGNNAGGPLIYVRMASLLHMSLSDNRSVWGQITNESATPGNGTGQLATDGFRWGILGLPAPNQNGNAFLYNQENRHLIFSTNHPTPANMSATAERMRITSFSAPTNLPGGGYGAYTPAGATSLADATRVAISYDPASPVTRPLSLLHLGYNTGLFSFPGGSTDGWRPWMDIGMFVSNGTDNTYLGLKQEPGIFGDRQDAVLSWGDNQTPGSPVVNGPDNLRFIFTSTTTGAGGSPPATLANGLETGRFYPGRDTLGTFGRFGVGDFTATGVNETPTHKIDVVGNGRFRFLPDTLYRNDSMVKKIVFVDSLGVLRWEYTDSLGLGNTARNGLTVDSGYVELGQDIGAAGDPGKLLNNREVPMNNFNILFKDPASSTANTNRIQVGSFTGVPYNQFAKLSSFNGENPVNPFRIGGFFTSSSKINVGSIPALFNPFYFGGLTPNYKFGSVSVAQDSTGAASRYIGLSGGAYSTSSQNNVGTSGKGYGSAATNYGVYGLAGGTNTSATNYGVSGSANGAGTNIGVYGSASGGVTDYAGYFDGDVFINSPGSGGFIVTPSDRNIKTDIDSIANALAIIKQLSPKTFYFDTLNTHHLRLSDKKQYGVIAQEVESVLPELVSYITKPADRDSAGNITNPAFTYKTVNYNAFIAILMKGMQEQQKAVDSLEAQTSKQDSVNHSLQDQINQLMAMITDCCNASHDNGNHYGHSMAPLNVELRDGQSIVLDQNVPNPFAEQTTISYFLPDNVSKAQILFYNAQGRLIQSTELTERGKGQLNVFASDLTNGIYTYTLVADGKIMETKKMIKQ